MYVYPPTRTAVLETFSAYPKAACKYQLKERTRRRPIYSPARHVEFRNILRSPLTGAGTTQTREGLGTVSG